MKEIESTTELLNEIFSEFNDASTVFVFYQVINPEPSISAEPLMQIISVNGYITLFNYTCAMNEMQMKLLSRIKETEQQLEPQDRQMFLIQAISRCKQLMLAVAPVTMGCKHCKSQEEGDGSCRVFEDVVFINMNGPDIYRPDTSLRMLTAPYASLWQLILDEILQDLQCSIDPDERIPDRYLLPQLPMPDAESRMKLCIKTSVPLLAALCRILYDSGVFKIGNKAKFCRIIVNLVCTPLRTDISPASFKNHFDAPCTENIQKLIAELGILLQFLRKFNDF